MRLADISSPHAEFPNGVQKFINGTYFGAMWSTRDMTMILLAAPSSCIIFIASDSSSSGRDHTRRRPEWARKETQ